MTQKSMVDKFISKKNLAVVGVSRNEKKFGSTVYRELKKKNYTVQAVNPSLDSFDGDPCYPNLGSLPVTADGAVLVVPPAVTEQIVEEAHRAGIKSIWMQQGSESEKAIQFCRDNGIEAVHGECIMMFAEPVESFHKFHRFIWKIFGKLPK
jgi:predicted CoA-binding protein